jgi:hypothetical protein
MCQQHTSKCKYLSSKHSLMVIDQEDLNISICRLFKSRKKGTHFMTMATMNGSAVAIIAVLENRLPAFARPPRTVITIIFVFNQ